MAELIAHNFEQIETIFQLLGDKENDITRAIAWTMKSSPSFLSAFIESVAGVKCDTDTVTIMYQQFEKTGEENGYTDLELTDRRNVHIVLEAKRGWNLPGRTQLTKYAYRPSFLQSCAAEKRIVTLSECSQVYATKCLPFKATDNGIPVVHVSWKELRQLANQSRAAAKNIEKHLLDEFSIYLGGIMTMQDKTSNYVYVVSLKGDIIPGTACSYIDLVKNTGHYYCPVGDRWPKDPPNYIGFRYGGILQTIHHIEGYTVTRNIHEVIDLMPDEEWEKDYFVFNLGPAIIPAKTVKTGKIYRNGRVWAMLDTLLTCDTIREARDISQQRQQE